jgi:putative ABC transport system substrate-binding protein
MGGDFSNHRRARDVWGAGRGAAAGKILRIGFLDGSTASGNAVRLEAFRQELSKLGWIEGKNITIQYRFAEQNPGRLPELAAELVRLKVDLVVVVGNAAALAGKKAITTIPIVIASAGHPVALGLVASLARPGGNVTGLSSLNPELNTKRLEILKDAVPKLARVGLLRSSGGIATDPGNQLKELRAAAVALKLKLEEIVTQPDAKSLESAFQTAKQKQVGAIMPQSGNRFFAERKRIVELAGKYRLPAIYSQDEFVEAGGLMSYGGTSMTSIGARLFTWTRSLRVLNQLIYRCSKRPSLNSSLISKLRNKST